MADRQQMDGDRAPSGETAERTGGGLPASLPVETILRFQAALFGVGALLGIVWLVQSPAHVPQRLTMAALGAVDLGIGAALLAAHGRRAAAAARTWALPVLFTLIATVQGIVSRQPNMFALFAMLAFVWVGVSQPRWTSVKLAPVLAGSCLAVLFSAGFGWAEGIEATAGVIASVVVGEMLAWVTQRLRANEEKMRARDVRFRALVQHSSDVISITEPDTTLTYLSPSVAAVLGYEPTQVSGRRLVDLVHPEDAAKLLAPCPDLLCTPGGVCTIAARWHHADGSVRHMQSRVTNLLDHPDVGGLVFNTRDVTEQHALEEQLTRQAFHDELTGLANRALLTDRIGHALSAAERRADVDALLFLDLDDFKDVNDSLGHSAGDKVLVEVARRLQACVRAGDTVARFGGDEFAVLLEGIGREGAQRVVHRIIEAVREPLTLPGATVRIEVSVGVTYLSRQDDPEQVLRNADVAMYTAKARGGGAEVYVDTMHAALVSRLRLEADLRDALERDEFALWYQPVVDLATGRFVGVEALLRWDHPAHGVRAPGEFLPAAERNGLILPIGRWALREACAQLQRWKAAGTVPPDFAVAVNVSPRQLEDHGLAKDVRDALARCGLEPRHLVLELTESVLMDDTDQAVVALRAVRTSGVRVAIDDFGTGYSSLSYLRRLPIDVLKIDKAFVGGIGLDTQQLAVVETIVRLADALDLETIAEGVENAGQMRTLRRMGCDRAQGYLFARPADADTVAATLSDPRPVLERPPTARPASTRRSPDGVGTATPR